MPAEQPAIIPFPTMEMPTADNDGPTWPSPSDDLVDIPHHRRHDSETTTTIIGIAVAFLVAVVGGLGLGATYGAFIALCGEKYVNIGVACAFPFTMNIPGQVGFMWGHLQDKKWRSRISLVGFVACYYAVCVGWLAGVLDGPGFVFSPVTLAGHLFDSSNNSLWSTGWRQEIGSLAPWLLTLRGGELGWMFIGGFFSRGAATPYPYCKNCKRWMNDETKIRLKYDPPSTTITQTLAADLVAERYESLYVLNQPVNEKDRGLQLNVCSCPACDANPVLDATWYRTTPDPHKDEIEQMLERGTGTRLVGQLIVSPAVYRYAEALAKTAADKNSAKAA